MARSIIPMNFLPRSILWLRPCTPVCGSRARRLHSASISAIRNPHVDIIGHPTGRLIPDREGADLDMEAVLNAAAETGVALEINAHPSRLRSG